MEQDLFSGRERGIIIAADVKELSDLSALVKLAATVPEVVAIKIGCSLVLRYGLPSVVRSIKELANFPIIYDHQKAGTDIPQMGKVFALACSEAGVQGVILFPQAGPKTLEAFVSAAFDYGLTPIVGLVMTHPFYLKKEGGFIDNNAPESICIISLKAGVRYFVLPGTKTEILKEFSKRILSQVQPARIMMPGIGSQGGSINIAFQAVKGHYPFAIIGSAIYNAPNPREALKRFAAEVRA